jgi:hypothetical protein
MQRRSTNVTFLTAQHKVRDSSRYVVHKKAIEKFIILLHIK